jgi:hypothetical protein
MNVERLFQYTTTNPPSLHEFGECGNLLVERLRGKFDLELRRVDEHIEPSSWVTVKIFIGRRENYDATCYYGVVSYSLRQTTPSITSVLLKFVGGNRVTEGRDSILVSTFTESGWEDFIWKDDEFGEWECDHVSEIAAVAD